jgi:hypothetical protein
VNTNTNMGLTSRKIFNIGLNRAGTSSLTEALGLLGYRAVHFRHMESRLYDIAATNFQAGRALFSGIDHLYDAFSDFAGHHFYPLLDAQYPNSKFIITLRDVEDWLDSRERKVLMNRANLGYKYHFLQIDREKWTLERELFLKEVESFFSNRIENLLLLDIPAGEGWEKLCGFLDVPVPDCPFPWKNRSGD